MRSRRVRRPTSSWIRVLTVSGVLAGLGACEAEAPHAGGPGLPRSLDVLRPAGEPVFRLGQAGTNNPWEHWRDLSKGTSFLDDSTVLYVTADEAEIVAVGFSGAGRWRQGGLDGSLTAFQSSSIAVSTLGGVTLATDGSLHREYSPAGEILDVQRIDRRAMPAGAVRFPFGVYQPGIVWWHANFRDSDSDWQRLVVERLDGEEVLEIDLPEPVIVDPETGVQEAVRAPIIEARGDLLRYSFSMDSVVVVVSPTGEERRIRVPAGGQVSRSMIDAHSRIWLWHGSNNNLGAWVYDKDGEPLFTYRGPAGIDAMGDLLLVRVLGSAGTVELHGLRVPGLSGYQNAETTGHR